jgi:hypothetical protein
MKTRSKVICLFCAAIVTLSACQQNAFILQNARNVAPGSLSADQPSAQKTSAVPIRYSANYLEEMEYQLTLFSGRFFESMSLPHQPPVR